MTKHHGVKKEVNIEEIINDPEIQQLSLDLYNSVGRVQPQDFIERYSI